MKEDGWWSCSYTTLDGGQVSEAELSAAQKNLNERLYRQEYQASFESFSGRCLYAFSRQHSVRNVAYNPDLPLHIGLDFNINPMSATIWQEYIENGKTIAIQIDEIVMPSSNTHDISNEILKKYGTKITNFFGETKTVPNLITVYPDPAGQARRTSASGNTDISILLSHGFSVQTRPHSPKIRDRLNLMNGLFENSFHERMIFISPKCIKSIESYERYSYIEGTLEPDKTKGYDHLVDAAGYYMFFRFHYEKKSININNILER